MKDRYKDSYVWPPGPQRYLEGLHFDILEVYSDLDVSKCSEEYEATFQMAVQDRAAICQNCRHVHKEVHGEHIDYPCRKCGHRKVITFLELVSRVYC